MIPFLDLHRINERFRKQIDSTIQEILDSGRYLLGTHTQHFEEHFATYCGTKYAIGCGNGLDALRLIIMGYGFGIGDEIIVPANTYIASILAISDYSHLQASGVLGGAGSIKSYSAGAFQK